MTRNTIRLLIIMATLSIVGIVVTQVFWLKKAFDLREKQFSHNVNIALKNVGTTIMRYHNHDAPLLNPVNQLSPAYYTVMVNAPIDANLLEALLKNEFQKRGISEDFEYGIYDCQRDRMVYGDYVSLQAGNGRAEPTGKLPRWNHDSYYFAVSFPHRDSNLLSEMGIWSFSSLVLLLVVVFFAYSLFIILQQKRLSEVQRDFINNMTHEFKTPISTIALSSEVLKSPDIVRSPERLFNYATIIQEEAMRLKSQVERVLQMATVDREAVRLNKTTVDVHEQLRKVVQNMSPTLTDRKAEVAYDLQATHPEIEADQLHLANIFYNLLDNAIKYTKAEPRIRIATRDAKNGLEICVTDNGIGMSAEEQKKIFDKFYRIPTGNVHDVKGFGLGLHYVQHMVKAHKGQVQVESQPGKGTTFRIYLPQA